LGYNEFKIGLQIFGIFFFYFSGLRIEDVDS